MSTAQAIAPTPTEFKVEKPLVVGSKWLAVAVAMLVAFWAFSFAADFIEMSTLVRFLTRMGANTVLLLFFLVWWLSNRSISRAERWTDFAVVTAGYFVAGLLSDKSVGLFGLLLSGLPFVLTVGTAWLIISNRFPMPLRRRGLPTALCLTWAVFALFRFDGLYGNQHSAFSWRWSPTAEQLFLAERAGAGTAANDAKKPDVSAQTVTLWLGDWPAFRGLDCNGQVHGLKIDTAWNEHPPKEVWRRRVGPAWSSMIVVDNRLFTQEQRGEREAVVCYDAATGNEIWAHFDEGRFADNLSGAGPRATPTFADGRIYTLGGFGLANCLDAATGRSIWSRLLYAPAAGIKPTTTPDSNAAIPQWAVSNSPAVAGETVVFFAGAQPDKGLLAYNAKTGEPKWSAATGINSYASPETFSVNGGSLILMLSNLGLAAVDSNSGHLEWEFAINGGKMFSPIDQPQPVGDGQFLISTPAGVALIQVVEQDGHRIAKQVWESTKLKPSLNDFVVQDGAIYGFDDNIFCCLDLKTGKRRWKAGRYGSGQVLLLADQKLLLVVSEAGEVVLVAANAERHEEIARFQAISGKTWNHPIIAHGRLYMRNAEEMACFALPSNEDSPKPSPTPRVASAGSN